MEISILKQVLTTLIERTNTSDVKITYGGVCSLLNDVVKPRGLKHYLNPIKDACERLGLPPLTIIVVSSVSGLPGDGFFNRSDLTRYEKKEILDKSIVEVVNCKDWTPLLNYFGVNQ